MATETVSRPARLRRGGPVRTSRGARAEARLALWLLIPAGIVLAVIIAYPVVRAIWLSLYSDNRFGTSVFIGFRNYTRAFTGTGSQTFWQAFSFTTLLTLVTMAFELVIGFGMALIMNRAFRGRGLVRGKGVLCGELGFDLRRLSGVSDDATLVPVRGGVHVDFVRPGRYRPFPLVVAHLGAIDRDRRLRISRSHDERAGKWNQLEVERHVFLTAHNRDDFLLPGVSRGFGDDAVLSGRQSNGAFHCLGRKLRVIDDDACVGWRHLHDHGSEQRVHLTDRVLGGPLVFGRELRPELAKHALERRDGFCVTEEPLLAYRDVLQSGGGGVLLKRSLEFDQRAREVAIFEEVHAVREVPFGLVGHGRLASGGQRNQEQQGCHDEGCTARSELSYHRQG